MKNVVHRRPSASMVVAVTALVVAASGTAVAAAGLVNGDKLIAKRSLSGNRLRSHTITGTQVNLNRLGKVPSAKSADRAATAVLANSATTAGSATSAANAATLGGQPATAFDSSSNFARSGVVGTNEGQSVTLATFGPFTLTLTCVKVGGGAGQPDAQVFATSSQANSEAGGQALPTAGVQSGNPIVDSGPSNNFGESGAQVIDFAEPGSAWMGDLNAAVNFAGDVHQCVAWGVIDKS